MNGLYIAASGAASELSGIDIAANNLANAGTPGFRRVLDMVESLSGNDSPYEYASTTASPTLDMSQGPLKSTGNPLDIGITGPGFMVVQTPQGDAYTRDGQLQVTPDGQLLAAGYPVTGEGGTPITVVPGPLSFATDGTVSVSGAAQGKIQLADPTGATLMPIGGGLYKPISEETLPPGSPDSQIHQGFVENASTNVVTELVAMMGVMRSYEASMKAVTSIDQSEDKTVQAFTLQA